MNGTHGRLAWLAVAAMVAAASAGRAVPAVAQQGLTVAVQHNLTFGLVIPGLPTTISTTDALDAAQVEVRGQSGAQVQVSFVLPAALAHPRGASLPLLFGPSDGGYAAASNTVLTAFDPRAPLVTSLSGTGLLYLVLGGTVQPGARQTVGSYSATITVTVAYLD